ncbi:hypothetical protein DPMN_064728 [Dreissena polymorpha]|uniref:Uncharacterized protein n=1 Tax=Dreissena polymorpha TaxID=45954 RepID=A0A9D4CDA2_DREPO|nr:hypothetical protein DPMN_064728 [Dreissena polymorpha]
MKVSAEKSKIMVKSPNNTSEHITIDDKKIGEVTSFKYLIPRNVMTTAASHKCTFI